MSEESYDKKHEGDNIQLQSDSRSIKQTHGVCHQVPDRRSCEEPLNSLRLKVKHPIGMT